MISYQRAQRIVLKHFSHSVIRQLALDQCVSRVLAQDIVAVEDGPDFDKSIMDGYALRAQDARSPGIVLKVVAFIPAGKIPTKRLKKGECSQIATGAMMPCGADAVVMKECVVLLDQQKVKICHGVKRGENVYHRGQHFKGGSVLLKKGDALNMARVALLAGQGYKHVPVYDAPRVALLATGNEIVEPAENKKKGCIWNASASMLSYACQTMSITPRYLGISRDDPKLLLKKIQEGLTYDCLIMTGAVSVGAYDFVPQLLSKIGVRPLFHKVALRPGKPLLFAVHKKCVIFGLPGNPVSSLVSFLLFIRPAFLKALGRSSKILFEEGILAKDVYNGSGRLSFLPARLCEKNGYFVVEPLPYSGSADMRAISRAQIFFQLKANQKKGVKNTRVKFFRIQV